METASCATTGIEDLRGAEVDGDVDAGELLSILVAVHDELLWSRVFTSSNKDAA